LRGVGQHLGEKKLENFFFSRVTFCVRVPRDLIKKLSEAGFSGDAKRRNYVTKNQSKFYELFVRRTFVLDCFGNLDKFDLRAGAKL
jgi:hypothetical protein